MKTEEKKLEYYEPETLRIDPEKPKQFLTKSGRIITVSKKEGHLSGVGKSTWFEIEDSGNILKPFKPIGVKNYIKRN